MNDQRTTRLTWTEEPMWVQRNELGVIVGISPYPPKNGDFIPTVPRKEKPKGAGQNANTASES